MAANGQFREDLYARLSSWTITTPTLRERREDILPHARHFLQEQGDERRIHRRIAGARGPTRPLRPYAISPFDEDARQGGPFKAKASPAGGDERATVTPTRSPRPTSLNSHEA